MDPRAAALLHRFAGLLGGEVQVSVRRGSGPTDRCETRSEVREVVTAVVPEEGVVRLEVRGVPLQLHLAEDVLLERLEGAGAEGTEVWGTSLSDEEAAARFLAVHLDESLGASGPSPSGWWSCDGGRFVPLPPWEAHARRRR